MAPLFQMEVDTFNPLKYPETESSLNFSMKSANILVISVRSYSRANFSRIPRKFCG